MVSEVSPEAVERVSSTAEPRSVLRITISNGSDADPFGAHETIVRKAREMRLDQTAAPKPILESCEFRSPFDAHRTIELVGPSDRIDAFLPLLGTMMAGVDSVQVFKHGSRR